ncbi:DUF4190 domain-containing protein [Compostimonas suwonensis]|uniref:Uncharacterized protein DUF4190 n=1 Tax=Compostimonas suwonensis TaxID=1048394 RepID=A0A2M9C4N8_9MICO|nr:DUF4190 domain-containing protein [Compostimonas suwonensis]PJJ65472.1 uncharacterized protein DUF4190 [Compostimonas suwonensis]
MTNTESTSTPDPQQNDSAAPAQPIAPAQPSAQPAQQYGQQPSAPVQPQYAQPYGQAPYGQAPYGQAPYVQAQFTVVQPQPKGLSITSLVLGLVSILFGFTFLLPIGAVVFGIIGVRKEPAGRGMSVTGIILGGLCLLGWIVLGGLVFAFLAAVVGSSAAYSTTY